MKLELRCFFKLGDDIFWEMCYNFLRHKILIALQ